ncbi:hypothetical protein [Dechloromonas denitrificans]|uniref:hypothetical protein n=1 Tax=Dechloromonas denitrificans TaxID=281362 RepID=UPI001CF839B2|nr:hypothetical protein [Dechloromonas denitrificans]UCV02289.1 hypothetical protein KI611_14480 [Dechloromonas denitrificans]
MTPEQKAALEAVAGRELTAQEYVDIDALLSIRNDVKIADIINTGRPAVVQSIRVEDVFDVLYASGDYMTLKAAQLAGNALAIMAFAVLADAKTIGPGTVNLTAPVTVSLLDQLVAAELLSLPGNAALLAKANVRQPAIHYTTLSDALNVAEGRLTL